MKLLLFLCLFLPISPLNILVYNPIMGHSHCNFFNKVSDVLVKAGHRVVQLSPTLNDKIRSGSTLAERITLPINAVMLKEISDWEEKRMPESWTQEDADPIAMLKMVGVMMEGMRNACQDMVDDEELLVQLRTYNFDVFMSEPMDMCGYGISRVIGIPHVINALSFVLPEAIAQYIGCPIAPSYVPSMQAKFGEEMTFVERITNVFSSSVSILMMEWMVTNTDEVFKNKYGDDFPTPKEIMVNSSFVFTNSDPLVDFPRPTIHKVIDIGGIAVPEASTEKLTKEWQKVLSLRNKTVLLSFGSVAKSQSMPEEFKKGIQKTLRSFPEVTFIWKYEKAEDNIGVPLDKATADGDNIVTVDWVPQTDLLSDPRLTGFITHGGMGSTNEGIIRGVPLVVIPVLADQFRNAKMVERLGTGIIFSKKYLSNSAKLSEVVRELLENEELRSNAKRISSMIENRPFSMAETLVKYTEFAVKMGPFPQLDPFGRQLNFFQYFLVDVFAVVAITLLTLLISITYLIKRLCSVRTRKLKIL